MDILRQRQVFKAWFNTIDILKQWKNIEDYTEEYNLRKLKKNVFQVLKKFTVIYRNQRIISYRHKELMVRRWLH